MIIVGQSTPSLATPNALRVTFHCVANEATPVMMEIDAVYVYMQKGETREIEMPETFSAPEGRQVPLHEIALPYSQQHKDWGLAWEMSELPDRNALRANPALPHIRIK